MNNFPHRAMRPGTDTRPWFAGAPQIIPGSHHNQIPALIHREQQQQQYHDRSVVEQKLSPHQQHKQPMPKQHGEQYEMEVDQQHRSDSGALNEHSQPVSQHHGLSNNGQQYQQVPQNQKQQVLEQHQVLLQRQQQQQHHRALLDHQRQQQEALVSQQQHVLAERQQHQTDEQPQLPNTIPRMHHHHAVHELPSHSEGAGEIPGISETFRQIANQHGVAVTTSQSTFTQKFSTSATMKPAPSNLAQEYSKRPPANLSSVIPENLLGVKIISNATSSCSNLFSGEMQRTTANSVVSAKATSPAVLPVSVAAAVGFDLAAKYSQASIFTTSQTSVHEQHGATAPSLNSSTGQHQTTPTSSSVPSVYAPLGPSLEMSAKHGFGKAEDGSLKPSVAPVREYFPLPVPLASKPGKTLSNSDVNSAYKCDHCGLDCTSTLQLKHHLLAHFDEIVKGRALKDSSHSEDSADPDAQNEGHMTVRQRITPPAMKPPRTDNSAVSPQIEKSGSDDSGTVDHTDGGTISTAVTVSIKSEGGQEGQMEVDPVCGTLAEGEANLHIDVPSKKIAKKSKKKKVPTATLR